MKKYIIVESDDLHDFVQQVNEQLNAGFECVGGVAVLSGIIYIQAMIKEN